MPQVKIFGFVAFAAFCIFGHLFMDAWTWLFVIGVVIVGGVPWELANWDREDIPEGAPNGEDIREG